MIEGFDFTVTPEEEAEAEAYQEGVWEREYLQRLNSPSAPVHENLKVFRKAAGLTQKEVAIMMEVDERSYRNYESGARTVPTAALINLAVVTDCDLNEIMLGRTSRIKQSTINIYTKNVQDAHKVLAARYPDMDDKIKFRVAHFAATHDWRPFYSNVTDTELIRAAVVNITGYMYHPEDAPPPPCWEYFDDEADYEAAFNYWQDALETSKDSNL